MAAAADESIGNLTKALHTALGDNVLIVIAGDNGGMPGAAGNNFPLRGHKAELYEGGIRNNAVIYSRSAALVPEAMRGATYKGGLVHVTDWHAILPLHRHRRLQPWCTQQLQVQTPQFQFRHRPQLW